VTTVVDDVPGSGPGPRTSGARRWKVGIPFVAVHVACLAVFLVGWSPVALVVCVLSYTVRILGITVFYHRGFSHRAFRTGRAVQLVGATVGASAAQRGPLWWVAHHRVHHRYTDRPGDPHSPVVRGLLGSHLLWLFDEENQATNLDEVPDLARYPELRVLDRFHHLVPLVTAAAAFGLGVLLGRVAPSWGTSGWQLLEWGFVIPTVALYHSTFAVNSLAHRFGSRRFATRDASRNNRLVSFLTLGEGWHNNHHRFPNSARQGLTASEPDPAWWAIVVLARLGLARDLRPVPAKVLAEGGLAPGD